MRRSKAGRPEGVWPRLRLPITPPYPPMEARLAEAWPPGGGWLFEPKWDGFRCLAFREGEAVALQSKAGQPLARYFPEIVDALRRLSAPRFVLDGEIVVWAEGTLSFDALLQRIHPSERRVRRLAAETPAALIVFDLLVDAEGRSLVDRPLAERRQQLESFAQRHLPRSPAREGARSRAARVRRAEGAGPAAGVVQPSPAARDRRVAQDWYADAAGLGLDGVIAKRIDAPYASGERTAMLKVKRIRTADCVVGGFRYAARGQAVGSLLLGLFDRDGVLHHVGFTSSFSTDERQRLLATLEPLMEPPGFTGRAPGGPSRWSSARSEDWQPVRPALVCEVRYDHWSGDRFRHGATFLRWRPDKAPRQCTFDQVRPSRGDRERTPRVS